MPEFVTIASITVICFAVGFAVKVSPIDDKFIPVIVALFGAALGVVGFYTMPEFPTDSLLDAIAAGIASGWAATGVHQTWKQLSE